MATAKKRRKAITKVVKKGGRTAKKRGGVAKKRGTKTAGSKKLVLEVVQKLEHKLEEMPTKIRSVAKRGRKAASRKRVLKEVVSSLEKLPTRIRTAAKKRRRSTA